MKRFVALVTILLLWSPARIALAHGLRESYMEQVYCDTAEDLGAGQGMPQMVCGANNATNVQNDIDVMNYVRRDALLGKGYGAGSTISTVRDTQDNFADGLLDGFDDVLSGVNFNYGNDATANDPSQADVTWCWINPNNQTGGYACTDSDPYTGYTSAPCPKNAPCSDIVDRAIIWTDEYGSNWVSYFGNQDGFDYDAANGYAGSGDGTTSFWNGPNCSSGSDSGWLLFDEEVFQKPNTWLNTTPINLWKTNDAPDCYNSSSPQEPVTDANATIFFPYTDAGGTTAGTAPQFNWRFATCCNTGDINMDTVVEDDGGNGYMERDFFVKGVGLTRLEAWENASGVTTPPACTSTAAGQWSENNPPNPALFGQN
jgi:hypothetical protein